MILFIEFWKAKDAWHQLTTAQRLAYAAQIGPVLEELKAKGVIIQGWGVNSDTTEQRADFDFYAVTKFPTQDLLKSFQTLLDNAKWYTYFDQMNMSGENLGVGAITALMVEL
jgi:hypothetical protein